MTIFSFTQEKRKEEICLVLETRESIEKTLLQALQKDAIFLDGHRIGLSNKKSFAWFQKLVQTKQILWKGRALFYNPFVQSKICLHACRKSDGIFVKGVLILGNETFDEIEWFFFGAPLFGIVKQQLFCVEDVYGVYLLGMEKEGVILVGEEQERFCSWLVDPPDGCPKIIWTGPILSTPFPFITLQDAYGIFAHLSMNYGSKSVDVHDGELFFGRNCEEELIWEKDVINAGYQKRQDGYYCPADQVKSALQHLWDAGFVIIDKEQRKIVKMTSKDLSISLEQERLTVRGSLQFEEHTISVGKGLSVLQKPLPLVELSSSTVGWLEDVRQELEGLIEDGEEGFVPKRSFGQLYHCMQYAHLSSQVKPLCERLQGVKSTSYPPVVLPRELYSYQEEGRKWMLFLAHHGFSGLLADEMGLGKSVQVLAFLASISFSLPILIVVPASLIFQWKHEWEKWVPHLLLYIHTGPHRKEQLDQEQAILTSYTYLRLDQERFCKTCFSCIILDEAQVIKNPESQIARIAYMLQSTMRLCLTGTPIENRTRDLWSLFHFLEPELLEEEMGDMTIVRKKLQPFLLRRGKEEIAHQLPEKIEQMVFIDMDEAQKMCYDQWLKKAKQGPLQKRMDILEAILRLRQIAIDPRLVGAEVSGAKIERVLVDLEEVLPHKVLVYSQFTEMLGLLRKECIQRHWTYAYLDGSVQDRETVVKQFQEDPACSILLISLKAGGIGLNLTAGDFVFMLDPWWNDAVERQAIDRAHRLGRQGTVVARRYITLSTVEEKMCKIKDAKSSLMQGLFEEIEGSWSLEELSFLLS